MIDIENLKLEYFQNDIPVPYKLRCGHTINIYPIKVKDWHRIEDFALLNIHKNEINDINIIQMSYLQFLNEAYFPTYTNDKEKFLNNMSLSFKLERGKLQFGYINNKVVLLLLDEDDNVSTNMITSSEFDEICKIIFFQNIADYDDIPVSQDMRKIISDYISAMPKNKKTPTLEDKKIYLFSKKNISMQEINEMSYRLFSQCFDMLYDCEEYLATRIIQASQKFKIEQQIEHPLYAIKPTIFETVVGSKQQLLGEFNKIQ